MACKNSRLNAVNATKYFTTIIKRYKKFANQA